MPTEAYIQAVRNFLPSGEGWNPQLLQQQMEESKEDEVVFDEKQQAKLDEIVRKASARAGEEARKEAERLRKESETLALKLAEAEKLAEKAKNKKESSSAAEDVEALKAQIVEIKSAGLQTVQEKEQYKRLLAEKEKEVVAARDETLNLRKSGVIKDAASKANFVDPKAIYKLTAENIKFDEATGHFSVVGDDGQPRLNTAYDPMTIEQFYAEFAAKNSWAVKGDMKPGSGSTTSTKYDGGLKQFKLEEIFGKGSNSKLANDLYKADSDEYKKLRTQAVAKGLIA